MGLLLNMRRSRYAKVSSKYKLINISMEKECHNNAAGSLWEQIFRDVSLVNNNAICVFTVDVNLLCINS